MSLQCSTEQHSDHEGNVLAVHHARPVLPHAQVHPPLLEDRHRLPDNDRCRSASRKRDRAVDCTCTAASSSTRVTATCTSGSTHTLNSCHGMRRVNIHLGTHPSFSDTSRVVQLADLHSVLCSAGLPAFLDPTACSLIASWIRWQCDGAIDEFSAAQPSIRRTNQREQAARCGPRPEKHDQKKQCLDHDGHEERKCPWMCRTEMRGTRRAKWPLLLPVCSGRIISGSSS